MTSMDAALKDMRAKLAEACASEAVAVTKLQEAYDKLSAAERKLARINELVDTAPNWPTNTLAQDIASVLEWK